MSSLVGTAALNSGVESKIRRLKGRKLCVEKILRLFKFRPFAEAPPSSASPTFGGSSVST